MHRLAVFVVVCCAVVGCGTGDADPYRAVAGGDADRGKAAIARYGCGACHVIPGAKSANGMVGPPLTAFGRRSTIAGEVSNTPDQLVQWIMNPPSIEPKTGMPNLGVTERDARDIMAYLYTLH